MSNTKLICGYMVVRKAKYSFYEDEKKPEKQNPLLDGKLYGGFARLEWVDLMDEHYQKNAPLSITELINTLRENNNDITGIRLLKSYADTKILLNYCNRIRDINEIIAVYSPELASYKGSFISEKELNFLGYDVGIVGEWSIIENGIAINPEFFLPWVNSLNEHMLFSKAFDLEEIQAHYDRLSLDDKAEPYETSFPFHLIEVYDVSSVD